MARPDQADIATFMSITSVSERTAIQKLQEHDGDLNAAINAHFSEGDRNITRESLVAATQDDDAMDVDDAVDVDVGPVRHPFSLSSSNRNLNPFSFLDPHFGSSIFDSGTSLARDAPVVSHPREVREIPIEVIDRNEQSDHSGSAPTIEDVSGNTEAQGPEIRGTVIIDDDDDNDNSPTDPVVSAAGGNAENDHALDGHPQAATSQISAPISRPSAPVVDDLPDYSNDIEEQMIRAAIEASKRDAEMSNQQQGVDSVSKETMPQPGQSHLEDSELAHAVSLSLKTAEREKALRELDAKVGVSDPDAHKDSVVEGLGNLASPNGRLQVGSSSVYEEETDDMDEQPLVRNRSRNVSTSSVDAVKDVEEVEVSPHASPQHPNDLNPPQVDGSNFHADEWGGISSLEHDEAVMLEAAMFGVSEGTRYHIPFAPHHLMQNGQNRSEYPYALRMPRPPSPSLTAQRLLREQQDDEYQASLQADREKELKAKEEAEAALAEQRQKDEELRKKLEEEQEIERQLAAKEASLPQEPPSDDVNAVTLLVRMPDGSRRGRRFLKSDKLQCLFDFIDVARTVKPQTYRLVRPYPRRAFSDGESTVTLNELGLTSKQEALFLELI